VHYLSAAVAAAFNFKDQPSAICVKSMEATAQFQRGPGRLRFVRQTLNQRAPLNDEIRLLQRDGCSAAIGEKFEAANLVDDTRFGRASQQPSHPVSDDERPRGWLKRFDAFEHAHWNALARQQRGCK
jgi:hypothetical protein